MTNNKIIKALVKVTNQRDIHLEPPEVEEHGDYSTNIALRLKTSAKEIVAKLQKDKELSEIVEKIEVAGPGFVNFYLKDDYLINNLSGVGGSYGKNNSLDAKKIIVEFTDPNPFKEFHIGHLYSNTVGESICRLLESSGGEVKRANYQGDVGLHVAKSIWGLIRLGYDGQGIKKLEDKSIDEKVKELGKAYSLGTTAYDETEKSKQEIEELNKKIFELDPEIKNLYEKGRAWSLEYFEKVYKRLGTKFDYYYFESASGKVGLEIVQDFLKKGVFEKSEGAIIFPGEKYGLHTRVFINSQGLPTYEAKELGLAPTKYKDFKYDLSIIITANEIDEYFKVLLAALKKINPSLGEKTMHLSHGIVKLPEGKMSSRTGKIVTGEWLLDEVKKKIIELHKTDEQTAEKIAVGAVKYALLKSNLGQDIVFSFEESVSVDGNSGPYLQYTYARTQSVIKKSKDIKENKIKSKDTLYPEEKSVLRLLNMFPEVVEKSAATYSPSTLCTYLYNLAQKYNTFYNKHKVIGSQKEEFRLKLTSATGIVVKSGLNLLGIDSPERM
ncbi:MAG: arginine--tRNA ligase [Patescibacteria group bacterium]